MAGHRLQRHREELFIALQRLIPQHLASRLLGGIADSQLPWLKNRLIRLAAAHYRIDLDEADIREPTAYPSFNAFFTRHLRPDARPIDTAANTLVSPADGAISQIGAIADGQVLQAKGRRYSTQALLGGEATEAAGFRAGSFTTIYLSPRDYHRVHMPLAATLVAARYIPGRLFSVNATTTREIDQLFARNERLVCLFDSAFGKVAVVLVGALLVAGIESVWHGRYRPGQVHTETFEPGLELARGDELGLFRFGSTVIVLTERPVSWNENAVPEAACTMGRGLGEWQL